MSADSSTTTSPWLSTMAPSAQSGAGWPPSRWVKPSPVRGLKKWLAGRLSSSSATAASARVLAMSVGSCAPGPPNVFVRFINGVRHGAGEHELLSTDNAAASLDILLCVLIKLVCYDKMRGRDQEQQDENQRAHSPFLLTWSSSK